MMAATDNAMVGEMRHNELLSNHTSWRVGGPARRFYRPADSADLINFLKQLPATEPLLWLGLGSNILVRDGGFNGTVISTQGRLNGLELVGESGLRAEAGVASARVARFAAGNDLCGVEFLAGIPGTMGGALALNAGAFGSETWDWVTTVETVDRSGEVRLRDPSDFTVGYRQVTIPEGEWFLAVQLELKPGDGATALNNIQTLLAQRTATQPIGLPSCGSVFRNPEGDHAARLIEAAGLKGYSIGGATVSTKHSNFIINSGGATAADIEALISHVQEQVEQESGVRLQPEVHIVGEEERA
jgi:UDP-N-acetylmuramate dehydrogenase